MANVCNVRLWGLNKNGGAYVRNVLAAESKIWRKRWSRQIFAHIQNFVDIFDWQEEKCGQTSNPVAIVSADKSVSIARISSVYFTVSFVSETEWNVVSRFYIFQILRRRSTTSQCLGIVTIPSGVRVSTEHPMSHILRFSLITFLLSPEFQRNYHEAEDEIHWIIINSKNREKKNNAGLITRWFLLHFSWGIAWCERGNQFSLHDMFRAVRSMHIRPTIVVELFMQIPRFSCFVARPSTTVADHRHLCQSSLGLSPWISTTRVWHFDRSMLERNPIWLAFLRRCSRTATQKVHYYIILRNRFSTILNDSIARDLQKAKRKLKLKRLCALK